MRLSGQIARNECRKSETVQSSSAEPRQSGDSPKDPPKIACGPAEGHPSFFSADTLALFLRTEVQHAQQTLDCFRALTKRRVDLVEICAPWDSPLADAVERAGGFVMRLGLHNGFDLSTREGYVKAAYLLRKVKPRYVHVSPPCFPFTCMQNANQRNETQKEQLLLKQAHGRRILKNCAKLLEIQIQELGNGGGSKISHTEEADGGFEQPLKASSWKLPEVRRMIQLCGQRFRVDGCQHGLVHPQLKKPMLKSFGWLSTHFGIRKALEVRCNHGPHEHIPIEGSLTALTATYPPLLCERFARALMEPRALCTALANQTWAMSNQIEPAEASAPENPVAPDVPVPVLSPENQELLRKIRLLHTNLGHPSKTVLIRVLKEAGATANVLELASSFECSVCRQRGYKAPARPSAIPAVTEPWDTISVDTFWWSSPNVDEKGKPKEHLVGLSLFDEATDFHVCSIVKFGKQPQGAISSADFKQHFNQNWLRLLPKPVNLRYDAEGFFRSLDLLHWLEAQNIKVQPIAGEAPWQAGKHSRHLAMIKENMTSLAMELGESVSCSDLLDLVCSSKNELHSVHGFTPNQWSFGQGKGRLESYLQNGEIAPLHSARERPDFEEQLQRKAKARSLFLQLDARRRVQRALLYRQRQAFQFECGQLVYFFRRGRGHGNRYESRWYGPAKVVCVEKTSHAEADGNMRNSTQGSIIWIAHGTTLYRCAPEQLRLVTREVQNLSGLFGRSSMPSEILKDAQSSQRYQDIHKDLEGLKPDDEVHESNPNEEPSLLEPPHSQEPRFRVHGKSPAEAFRYGSSRVDRSHQSEERDQAGRANDGSREGDIPSALPADVPRIPGSTEVNRRTAQREDIPRGDGESSNLRDVATESPAGQHEVLRPDGVRRTPDQSRSRGSSKSGTDAKGQEQSSGPDNAVQEADRHEFQRHSLHWRETFRGQPNRDLAESSQGSGDHGAKPHADLHDRDAEHESGRPVPPDAHSTDAGQPLPDAGQDDADRGRLHGGRERGLGESQRRVRSRSRHRVSESNFIGHSELPDIEEEESQDEHFEVGCNPVQAKDHRNSSLDLAKIKKGCFSWLNNSEDVKDVSFVNSAFDENNDSLTNFFCYGENEVVEIILTVAPRDVHLKKRNGVSEWILNQKPKKNAEVHMKQLNEQDRLEMKTAMRGEVDSFLERDAIEIASRAGVDPQKLLTMRWVLTFKPVNNEQGEEVGKKAKARLIIRGYEDPQLLSLKRDSPTLGVHSRNCLLALCAINQWDLFAGDIKTAFLNGDTVPEAEQVFGDPPSEVRDMLQMKPSDVLRIEKVIYGLLHAPRAWMQKLANVLDEQGWQRSRLEQCVWRLYDSEGNLQGLLGCHVDDILCCGNSPLFQSKVKQLLGSFPFGSWQKAKDEQITFCGCEIKQNNKGDLFLSQERYALGLNEIPISAFRKTQLDRPVTSLESKQLRAALGALSWRATQTCPWISASVSVLQGAQTQAMVSDLLATNKLIRAQRQACEEPLIFSHEIKRPVLITYTDASWACRRDGSSQGGQLSVIADASTLDGARVPFSPLAWQSRRLPRVARSSTSAEVQMLSGATDTHEFLKQMALEWFNPDEILLKDADAAMRSMPSVMILDSKNLYDAMARIETSGLHLEEKRTAIDVLSIRERSRHAGFVVKWVDSDQQLADGLSKPNNYDHLHSIFTRGLLSIVFDPLFISAKKKRQMAKMLGHEKPDFGKHESPVKSRKEF